MANDVFLTDEYVAGILAEEAKDCSLKFSALGMDSSRADKKSYRPNTSFLQRIIKGTDSHNKAILANQAAESQARLKELEHAQRVQRSKTNPNASDIRKRQMGAIHAILGDKNRSRDGGDGPEAAKPELRRRHTSEKKETPEERSRDHRSSKREKDLFKDRRDESRRHRLRSSDHNKDSDTKDEGRRDESRRHRHSASDHKRDSGSTKDQGRRSRRRKEDDSDPDETHKSRHSRSRRERERSRSPRRHGQSRSPGERRGKYRHRSPERSTSPKRPRSSRRGANDKRDSDSSSDNDSVGPAPPPRHRGRGLIGGASSLDRRFDQSYDPKADVDAGSSSDAWDDAVQAYRDRKKMLQNREERLKKAGISGTALRQLYEGISGDDAEQPVVWSKVGEKRAWDVGKELEEEEMDEAPSLLSRDF